MIEQGGEGTAAGPTGAEAPTPSGGANAPGQAREGGGSRTPADQAVAAASPGVTASALAGDRPPRRILDRAPGTRFESLPEAASRSTGSAARAAAFGVGVGGIGVVVHVACTQVLLLVGPLILVAVTLGIAVGASVRAGGGAGAGAPSVVLRRLLGIGIAVGAVVVALGIAWGASGRYLGPLDFLDQVYGLTVPLQLAGAAAGALAGSR